MLTASEKSFSMKQVRLNHTMVLHIYKGMLDALNLNSMVNEFIEESKHWNNFESNIAS